jgi:hypothetical protein
MATVTALGDEERARRVRSFLAEHALWHSERSAAEVPFRVALSPYALPQAWQQELFTIGQDLALFQLRLQDLYREALRRHDWAFAAAWLDAGKDDTLLNLGRMKRLRRELPVLIRPDLFRVDGRFVASEIDAVPGGFGVVAALQEAYHGEGMEVVGGPHGIVDAFYAAMAHAAGRPEPVVAIVVSEESKDYLPEMQFLAAAASRRGYAVHCLHPREVGFTEEGLHLPDGRRIDVLYRFFELFDWKNVPKAELFFYAYKKGRVVVTPPIKAFLEEKLVFALLHHPLFAPYWQETLGEAFDRLVALFPPTWVVDHEEAPPQAFIYGLDQAGQPVRSFRELLHLTQRERSRWVLKPSGFSPLAWGSHGVKVGEDLPGDAWTEALETALAASRHAHPVWCLQAYRKPERTVVRYLDSEGTTAATMEGRARISPYYFRTDDGPPHLGGVLVTICPADKKVIHGMVDGVVAPGGL